MMNLQRVEGGAIHFSEGEPLPIPEGVTVAHEFDSSPGRACDKWTFRFSNVSETEGNRREVPLWFNQSRKAAADAMKWLVEAH